MGFLPDVAVKPLDLAMVIQGDYYFIKSYLISIALYMS